MTLEVGTATVEITGEKRAYFRCPYCERKLVLRNTYPFLFGFKTCPGCERVWARVGGPEDWAAAKNENVGRAWNVSLCAWTGGLDGALAVLGKGEPS